MSPNPSLSSMALDLPHPSTVVSFNNQTASTSNSPTLTGQLRAMELSNGHSEQQVQLPSIGQLFGSMDNSRRSSLASTASSNPSTSGSTSPTSLSSFDILPASQQQETATRRLDQVVGQLYPYPEAINRSIARSVKRSATRHAASGSRTRRSMSPKESQRPIVNIVKAVREKGARNVQWRSLSRFQNAITFVNPKLPQIAHGKGWTPLKANNINRGIAKPLLYRKNDVLDTGSWMVLQLWFLVILMLQHICQSGDAEATTYFNSLVEKLCTDQFPELPSEFTADL